jgi:hypothetical protein
MVSELIALDKKVEEKKAAANQPAAGGKRPVDANMVNKLKALTKSDDF